MINAIYWDLDETLVHTELREPNQKHIRFALEDGGIYYTIVRPCAKRLINFARELVGKEKVFILTSATKDYACEINSLAEFGFDEDHILAREDISNHRFATAYGGSAVVASKYANIENVLIDNLDARYNQDKVSFLGVWRSVDTNYLQIRDYYGVDFPKDPFEQEVMEFLENRQKAPPWCKGTGEEKMEIPPRQQHEG
jgi:FMN phosphatase YigB (HAD superfamily)